MEIVVKLNEEERALLNEVMETTLTHYDIDKDIVSANDLMNIVRDLMVEYHRVEEERDDLKWQN